MKTRCSILILLSFSLLTHGVSAQSFVNDSTLTIFNSKNYQFVLTILDPGSSNEERPNAQVLIKHFFPGEENIIMYKPVFCQYRSIVLKDFNNDGVKDILVLHTSSARSNLSYYLYLVTHKKRSFIPVFGFEELLNPEIDKKTGIITSTALYGNKQSFSFYKISKTGKLVKTGRSYEEEIK